MRYFIEPVHILKIIILGISNESKKLNLKFEKYESK